MKLSRRTTAYRGSPIGAYNDLLDKHEGGKPLLNISQGAPNYPPPQGIMERLTKVVHDPNSSRYTNRLGLAELRNLFSQSLSSDYDADVSSDKILITAGCNQAFCLTISSIADVGDEVILLVPFYFNHDMWLKFDRLTPVYFNHSLTNSQAFDKLEAIITPRTRAIVLVTPGNPTGEIIDSEIIDKVADLAIEKDIFLIIDETYKAFRASADAPHKLYSRENWPENIIGLYSFSKEYSIPGYRVGAIVASTTLLDEIAKLFDCISICAPSLGQEAVIEGLKNCQDWLDSRVVEIRDKQKEFESLMATKPGGFELLTSGGFYGWVKHPYSDVSTEDMIRRLIIEQNILAVPGNVFTPTDESFIRFSFANLTVSQIHELGVRLNLL